MIPFTCLPPDQYYLLLDLIRNPLPFMFACKKVTEEELCNTLVGDSTASV